ncbi:hypothetical protein Cgig2_020167 [Carnegiea gigantea]|uniref:Uncharacterized protein n=1 Tax=Carnegiea gigantea TaxID=171969 RepID=A0A9Q1KV90_9CARY|nr:hypothetical protein Cgig2_020167 [Carnegiea gigantea]
MLGVNCHLLWSDIPGLEDFQPCPCLLCIKQKGSQPIQKLPVTRLALPPLGAFHGLNCLSHKLGNGLRLVVLPYVKLKVMGRLSLLSCGLPKWSRTYPQPDCRCTKRKSHFRCFNFNFFSIAVMKPGLLLKQYHLKSPVSLGVLWTVCMRVNARAEQMKRKPETVVKSRAITKVYPASRRSERVWAPGNSGPSATNHSGAQPFLLSTDLPGANGPSGNEELVDTPSEDELQGTVRRGARGGLPEVELEIVDATSAPSLDADGAEQGLPCVPSASSSSGDLMRGVDLVFIILRTSKSVIYLSTGYVTSTSGLRTLGVEEYLQLDHEGVPIQKEAPHTKYF